MIIKNIRIWLKVFIFTHKNLSYRKSLLCQRNKNSVNEVTFCLNLLYQYFKVGVKFTISTLNLVLKR